ncbi:beta-ketoacyl synthase N-terminal-like domain-containing protein [Xylanibacter oryzae]|uniref:beta-ketoacyl synthase N-terminal-like domain-containing protein n=1 Tax=Xylanibacter oryzae TaxID=185293 RepID=UPI0004B96ECA|nr:beta-ketoacyl synthase N-terminal-like domain-containing protein [Xylanibacter oryzae]
MIVKIADNIISPLGFSSTENYDSVKSGYTALRKYESNSRHSDCFVASFIDNKVLDSACNEIRLDVKDYTKFEKMILLSSSKAIADSGIDASSSKVIFILSTTKGNVSMLSGEYANIPEDRELLGRTGRLLCDYFGNANPAIVVSNACISGVCAQITAMRCLNSGDYDYAVVVGADCQSPFIISGFQSFKALSDELCKPFDKERNGLNLGEAAGTIIYASRKNVSAGEWILRDGSIRNDANHISGPSRTGEGSYRALLRVMRNEDSCNIACLNVHGTATAYNDEMESIAIERSGMIDVPVNALKGYYGHTMGAAGIVESILSMHSIEDKTILATKGFETLGVSHHVLVSGEKRHTDKNSFIKLLSGFGGCNAALLFSKNVDSTVDSSGIYPNNIGRIKNWISITPTKVCLNDIDHKCDKEGKRLITELYRKNIGNYPKFFKMDMLCKLGFVASEMLLQAEGNDRFVPCEDRAVILFNKYSSLNADKNYQSTIQDTENYYPSPSFFVYTLPNIVTGEISIRNKYYGETSFNVLENFNAKQIAENISNAFQDDITQSVIGGWVDCKDDEHFEVLMFIADKEGHNLYEDISDIRNKNKII